MPEDQRFIAMTPEQLKALNPHLFVWVGMVFRLWGAAIGLGTMISAVAGTAYRHGDRWAWWALAIAIGLLFATYLWALWHGRDGI